MTLLQKLMLSPSTMWLIFFYVAKNVIQVCLTCPIQTLRERVAWAPALTLALRI